MLNISIINIFKYKNRVRSDNRLLDRWREELGLGGTGSPLRVHDDTGTEVSAAGAGPSWR